MRNGERRDGGRIRHRRWEHCGRVDVRLVRRNDGNQERLDEAVAGNCARLSMLCTHSSTRRTLQLVLVTDAVGAPAGAGAQGVHDERVPFKPQARK